VSYVISLLWFPILLAFALGVLVGMTSYGRQPRSDAAWLFGAAIVGAFLFIVAAWEMVPGRIGLWLEGTVLLLLAYFVGCVVGALWKDLQPHAVTAGGPAEFAVRAARVDAPLPVRSGAPDHRSYVFRERDPLILAQGGPAESPVRAGLVDAPSSARPSGPAERPYVFKVREPLRAAPAPHAPAPTAPVAATPVAAAPAPPASQLPLAVAPVPAAQSPALAPAPAALAETDTGDKPAGIGGPRSGKGDDLKRIRGIGRQNEDRLHGLGIWHFDQIAAWTARETRWVGHFLAFPGRIEREDWVGQARILAEGGETEFSRRVDRGEVETSLGEGGKPV
jgi:predicted flap endonuclease-1-like 5' DNA nuclease